jgi:type I restriction enzyme M protein
LGYTNEIEGIYHNELPVIIFDDFTTATKLVNFPFKVKSSAMKILHARRDVADVSFVFQMMQLIKFDSSTHKRYWISEYSKIRIPLPPLNVQRSIMEDINGYQKIIDGARLVVENYRPRIEVDPSWPVVKLGEVFSRRSENVLPMKLKDTIVNYIGLENIGHGNGKLIGNYQQNPALIKSTKNRYKVGDILYGKLRPNLRKVYLAQIDGICSTDIMVLCSKVANTNNYFYSKYFLSPIFHNEVMKYLRGAQLPRIGFDDFSKVQIPFPPLETQNEISEKIRDEEAIINKFAELIMLYEKKIQDRITKVWGE